MKKILKTSGICSALAALVLGSSFAVAGPIPPKSGGLDFLRLFRNCQNASKSLEVIMWCAVVDREGVLKDIRATDTSETPAAVMKTDAWRASIEIAAAKAYTAVSVSSNRQALSSEDVGNASQPGADLWGVGNTNPYRPGTGNTNLNPDDLIGKKHHGIVTFGGGVPIYGNPDTNCAGGVKGKLLGAVGVSGDTVQNDIEVAKAMVHGAGYCTAPEEAF
jgi:uncharacterized protein GlcG (DUF336 family)